MPYRRLPNTDTARIRAMKTALEKGKELPPHKLAFSSKTIVNLQKFLPSLNTIFSFTGRHLLPRTRRTRIIMKY